jgi:large conductance mechanosensitive channel
VIQEFRDFILRGSVVDLAVGVVIGAAFGTVITSLVTNILTPLLGLLGAPNFEELSVQAGSATLHYGLFLQALITFALVATALFFLVVKPMNHMIARLKPATDAPTKPCPHCVTDIPEKATRCPNCTSQLTEDK